MSLESALADGYTAEEYNAAMKERQAAAPQAPQTIGQQIMSVARPIVESTANLGGNLMGAPFGPTASAALGAGGYVAGKNIMDLIQGGVTPNLPQDYQTGIEANIGGGILGPVLGGAAGLLAKPVGAVLGKLSGVGQNALKEAWRGGAGYLDALRGKISGEDVTTAVKDALVNVKDQRLQNYQALLGGIEADTSQIDTRPIKAHLSDLMNTYKVKVLPTGELDTSRIAMGQTGRNDIKDIIQTVSTWGSKPGDNTAIGLDTLKRQLDDFYSDSSQARAFVTSMRNNVKDQIVKSNPNYAEMTKGYSEATSAIKDFESALMLRKHGMTGRVTDDMTLNRLMRSMGDNQELKADLLTQLGNKSGQDLISQVAGTNMSNWGPKGIAGSTANLLSLGGLSNAARMFTVGSPRVQGEVISGMGRGSRLLDQATGGATNRGRMSSLGLLQMMSDTER